MFGLLSPIGLAAVVFYVYVGVMAGRAAVKSGASWKMAAVHAAVWPVTMWKLINDLYNVDPE
jgi:hypothetical protein